ncbi:24158_t:CDS:2 [Gigaspora rosea]|nr:24158_t:CDS:2 [Gigaspora rosea]
MFANSCLGQPYEEIAKAILKKYKFGELWGLGRKIIVDAIEELVEDSNDDINHKVFEFFLLIQSKTSQRIVSRSKSSSKRIKNVLKKPNIKPKNKCRICKQKGHNSKTCKKKELSDVNSNEENGELRANCIVNVSNKDSI